ncbi:hypothetical protein D5086_001879 [Populus alba]|uniref:Uncharacterized protein n=1 Tax=Populus alba TaxID=43335 RepID=A0ACC4D0H7_POPAL
MPPNSNLSSGENPTTRPRPQPPPSNQDHHHLCYPTTARTTSSSSSSPSFRGCCCCLFLLFSLLALLILAVFLVIMLAVKPKKPQFDLQQVGVQYMGISAPNPSSSPDPTSTATPASASLSLTINMLFTAVNPNKVGIRYGESSFTVMYSGIPLGKALVPGFYQEAHSQRQVKATISVDRYSLMQAYASDLIRDASLNDRVELRVLGQVGAKIRVLDFDSPGVQVAITSSTSSVIVKLLLLLFAVGYPYRVDVSCLA